MNVLITGMSSGIGLGLAKEHLRQGDEVFGLSRRPPTAELPIESWSYASIDLSDFEAAAMGIRELLIDVDEIGMLWLNAGALGQLKDMSAASIAEMQTTFDVNVWANKVVLDTVFELDIKVDQVIAVSSGAAVNGNRGWNGYAISKAALNMLIQLYAAERPETHFSALAPGLVDTAMQDYICGLDADKKLSSIETLKAARGTANMPGPDEAAQHLVQSALKVRALPSGSFADIRHLPESMQ
ncbi:MAG: benzil reductase ((S)-benzoin forming) [Planctomycetota bacterium]|jgi:benzil reductase ((S)-benzoin forming)